MLDCRFDKELGLQFVKKLLELQLIKAVGYKSECSVDAEVFAAADSAEVIV